MGRISKGSWVSVASDELLRFCSLLRQGGADESFVHALATSSSTGVSKKTSGGPSDIFLVIPYFPQWGGSGVQRAVARLNKTWSQVLGYRIRVAWKLGGAHLVALVKGFNCEIFDDAREHVAVSRVRVS